MEQTRIHAKPAKKPAVIQLTPNAEQGLVFNVPKFATIEEQTQISASLVITNPTPDALCFKIKTTAPKNYCVSPNSGFLESRASITINVMLQPPLPEIETSKDKFLVQTIYKSDVEDPNAADMWKKADKTKKSLIMENRLKCRFNLMTTAPVLDDNIRRTGAAGAVTADIVQDTKIITKPPTATTDRGATTTTTVTAAVSKQEPKQLKPTATTPVVDSQLKNPSATLKPTANVTPKAVTESKQRSSSTSSNSTASSARVSSKPTIPRKTSTTSSSEVSAKKAAVATNPEQVPSIILLLAVFLLGYIFGKFVL